MAQYAPITVLDGKPTPASHTFVPNGESPKDPAINRFKESTGVKKGDNLLTTSLREQGTNSKFRMQLTLPVMVTETINGVSVPRVVRTIFIDMSMVFDELSTQQERKDAQILLSNLLKGNQPVIDGQIQSLEVVY